MLKVRLLAPVVFRPANRSLPVAVPTPGEYLRAGRGWLSGWAADMKIEVRRMEVFGK